MFDIGFAELMLVLVVGLLVVGPERLPETVKTVAIWVSRIKRQFSETRRDIEREIGADDIRRQIYNENIMRSLNESRDAIQRVVDDTNTTLADVNREIADAGNNIHQGISAQDKLEESEPQAKNKPEPQN